MTTIAEIKSALHYQIANTEDKKVLEKLQSYLRSLVKSDHKTVAYSSKLKPLSVKEYKAEIEEAITQYRKGKVISQKEMEKKI